MRHAHGRVLVQAPGSSEHHSPPPSRSLGAPPVTSQGKCMPCHTGTSGVVVASVGGAVPRKQTWGPPPLE